MDDEARFEGVLASFGPLSAERLEHLPRAVGLEPAVREATTALSRGATVLVSGKPGVGKTALIREVQRTIRDGPCHPELLGTQIYVSSVAQLLAGTVYAGWWQTKLAALTRDVALARSNGVRPLIWLTDFVNLLRECRGDKGKSIGEDLMPFIDSGELWIGGEVTPESLPLVLGDPRWRQRVEPLGLEEPSPRQMRAILEATVARLAPDVEGAPDDCVRRELGRALEQAQLQAARFLPEMAQPGASLRLVERALASGELTSLSVQQALCEVSGLPEAIVRDDLPMIYADVAQRLADRVIGQPEAIDAAANALLMVKAGLTNPRRPLAVLGFFGRSGVGKTELAKALAEELIGDDGALVRIDMSEFVGANAAVQFASAVVRKARARAISVCLFDEIEKADFNSLDVLLQVLSDGICTDEKGERVDLRQSIILLTSNIGFGLNDLGPGRALGFTASTTEVDENWQETARVLMAAGARFRPEFLGRIDRVVVFRQLNVAAVAAIARRELGLALGVSGIVGRDLEVRYGNELVDRIALAGCDPRFGARPLVAAIRDQVSAPLARWISARPGIRSRILQLIVDGQDQLRIDDGAYRTLDQFPLEV